MNRNPFATKADANPLRSANPVAKTLSVANYSHLHLGVPAMLVSLILVFREAMEAGLIVGIVLAATQGVIGRGRWIAGGMAVGIAGALVVAEIGRAHV